MNSLPNHILIKTYREAKHLRLDTSFIRLLELEIYRRNIQHLLLSAVK